MTTTLLPSIDEVRARVPAPLRQAAMVDRILVEETVPAGEGTRRRLAVDLSAGLGRGEPYFGRPVDWERAAEDLLAIARHLADVPIERVDIGSVPITDAAFVELLGQPWAREVRILDTRGNGITERGLGALFGPGGLPELRSLRVVSDALGGALDAATESKLEHLTLRECGFDEARFEAFAEHPPPHVTELVLDECIAFRTTAARARAHARDEVATLGGYTPATWKLAAKGRLGQQLKVLRVRNLALATRDRDAICTAGFAALRELAFDGGAAKLAGEALLTAITKADFAPTLEVLDLSNNGWKVDVFAKLDGEALPALRTLRIPGSRLPATAWKSLAKSGIALADLTADRLDGKSMVALSTSRLAATLTALRVPLSRDLKAAGVACLVGERWPALEILDLRGCGITDEALVQMTVLDAPKLRRLGLGRNHLTDASLDRLRALAARLEILDVSENALSQQGVAALSQVQKAKVRTYGQSDHHRAR
ncbi:MAG: hypothetical protein R3B48_15635 [Kofleriaceae bacterium]